MYTFYSLQGPPGPPGAPGEAQAIPTEHLGMRARHTRRRKKKKKRRRRSADGSEVTDDEKDGIEEVDEVIQGMATKKVSIKEGLMQVVDKMFEEIDKLNEEVMGYKFPKGTKENPAVTCRDVYLGHQDFQDGKYIINIFLRQDQCEYVPYTLF